MYVVCKCVQWIVDQVHNEWHVVHSGMISSKISTSSRQPHQVLLPCKDRIISLQQLQELLSGHVSMPRSQIEKSHSKSSSWNNLEINLKSTNLQGLRISILTCFCLKLEELIENVPKCLPLSILTSIHDPLLDAEV